MKFNFQLPFVLQIGQGDLRGISGGAQGDLRGISGGAHPLETFFKYFNKKNLCIPVLNSKYVDKILLEGSKVKGQESRVKSQGATMFFLL